MDHPFVTSVYCTGTSYEISYTHGSTVAKELHCNITTYTTFFQETAQITWEKARERAATQFVPSLENNYPQILEEMQGMADGAGGGLTRDDILTLNVRSEIALTNYADGCTSISQKGEEGAIFLAQNWDWLEELKKGMVFLHIKPAGSDIEFKFLSEAGIVGKFGMNSAGFGFCMNAIRSGAFDKTKFPVHVMSRRLLQFATSFDSAIAIIDKFRVASTINYMFADKSGKHADIECAPRGNTLINPLNGYVAHTNHLYGHGRPLGLTDHPAANSMSRLARIQELTEIDRNMKMPTTFESLRKRLSDKENTPFSICRDRPPGAVVMICQWCIGHLGSERRKKTFNELHAGEFGVFLQKKPVLHHNSS
ncbi:acyl-coenzyme A:6-aminopenicillanic-acid-acyltransferase [Mollisia scopiformis]|uniref:Acyl-coenzyme A:6-aminopenicillanic-acid-acyltransferase n=1 Tax=Mollisia scopiformis TaxID=149040 RepID=A0A194WZK9_MOLSC|nr:acyl-coenzyme A:6-aminopenicillanic-acid-acyltransferase [Mollisia scopiformis]KUJ13380.1 acyl-coenzyme A:6-aminopenicillanic-acid-acyltransferase [Mollisia scopiformis]